jgi:flagellar hook protein FlgE
MSLYGAMMTGVAALTANSTALSVASANIANVNTVGYKTATCDFATMLAATAGTSNSSSGSVTASSGQNVTEQGQLTSTSSATDLAISGNGFFVVSTDGSDTGTLEYTRAGSFTTNSDGDLVNSAGLYLMGWALDSSGNTPTNASDLTTINVSDLAGKAVASSNVSIQANLQASTTAETASYTAGAMASGTVTPDFERTINVYDSQGGTQPLVFSYVKTAANTWAYEVTYSGDSSNLDPSVTNNLIDSGTITFNSDGSLHGATSTDSSGTTTTSTTGSVSFSIPWSSSSGLTSQALTVDMGTIGSTDGITQYDTTSTLTSADVDGAVYGSVSGISISSDGTVSANFSNGLTQAVYKIPLATFANSDGLAAVSGNAYTTTPESGIAVVNIASTGGSGTIQSDELESSTVDLATEFTNMITTQRAYSAASRIVTTASEMLDQLLQMGR